MGDRCYLVIRARREDMPKVLEAFHGECARFGPTDFQEEDGMPFLEEPEANYGYYDARKALAEQGVVFDGWHAEGGEYNPALFCSWEGVLYDVDRDCQGDTPTVDVNPETGEPYPGQLKGVHEFLAARKKAVEYIKGGTNEGVRSGSDGSVGEAVVRG